MTDAAHRPDGWPAEVPLPFTDAGAKVRTALRSGSVLALGTLEAPLVRFAELQGAAPPRPFERIRALVLGDAVLGDTVLGDAVLGDAVLDPPLAALTETAGATVVAVSAASVEAGAAVVDREVDGGADLLVPVVPLDGPLREAAVIVAASTTGTEPARAVQWTGDDREWMRTCVAVRDGLRRVRLAGAGDDPWRLLELVGSSSLAALVGVLVQAAVRRTPVLLDGVAVAAAAMLGAAMDQSAVDWWMVPDRGTDPVARAVWERLRLDPADGEAAFDLRLRLGGGAGALATLPTLQALLAVTGAMLTF
jgi:NaMN:DMB phosphoribosyltransferase